MRHFEFSADKFVVLFFATFLNNDRIKLQVASIRPVRLEFWL